MNWHCFLWQGAERGVLVEIRQCGGVRRYYRWEYRLLTNGKRRSGKAESLVEAKNVAHRFLLNECLVGPAFWNEAGWRSWKSFPEGVAHLLVEGVDSFFKWRTVLHPRNERFHRLEAEGNEMTVELARISAEQWAERLHKELCQVLGGRK